MHHPLSLDDYVSPKTLAPDGVWEDNCWAISGGFALKLIVDGHCKDFAIIKTVADYIREQDRLEGLLGELRGAARYRLVNECAARSPSSGRRLDVRLVR